MALKGLIENQTIIIDDHKRGNREVKDWDDKSIDVHIDKITNFPVQGKQQDIRIRVPINSDRPILIQNNENYKLDDIPKRLQKEITKAFDNKESRKSFILEVVAILKNFKTNLSSEGRIKQIFNNLSKHFDLKWSEIKIATYSNEILTEYSEAFIDDSGKEYVMSADSGKIKIGRNNGYGKNKSLKNIKNRFSS